MATTDERIAMTQSLQFRVEAGRAELVGVAEVFDGKGERLGGGYCYRAEGEPFVGAEVVIDRTGRIERARLEVGSEAHNIGFAAVTGSIGGDFSLATSIPARDCAPSPEMVERTAEIRRAHAERLAEGERHGARIGALRDRLDSEPATLTAAELGELLADADDEYEARVVGEEAIRRLEAIEANTPIPFHSERVSEVVGVNTSWPVTVYDPPPKPPIVVWTGPPPKREED